MKVKRYYKYNLRTGQLLTPNKSISEEEYRKLSIKEKDKYVPLMDNINE